MDNFDRGEQNILDNTEKAINEIKQNVFTVGAEAKESTADILDSPSSASKGQSRVLTMDNAPKVSPPVMEEKPVFSDIPVAAAANLFPSDTSDRGSNSGSSFVVVLLACIAFVVLAAVIGYGIAMMFK